MFMNSMGMKHGLSFAVTVMKKFVYLIRMNFEIGEKSLGACWSKADDAANSPNCSHLMYNVATFF